ncbi:DNA-binding protein [Laribacter hongkongensis]|uniref:DNA-binding protein n=1 Tax=Laribacter hongkongensis TaxID=168471 RepID=UPI0012DE16E1|nr:DNA-binding protein [Laribacter hongkongensis]MCG9097080.1 DNA-binding protein [Laribacter hongkongensis]
MSFVCKPLPAALGAAGWLLAGLAMAAPEVPSGSLAEQLKQMQREWSQYRSATEKQLASQQARIDQLEAQLGQRPPPPPPPRVSASPDGLVVGAPAAVASTGPAGGPAISSTPVSSNPATQSRTQDVAQALDVPGVLTPKGRFVLEPSLQYSYSSSDRVALLGYTIIPAITIGLIDVRRVNRSSWIGSIAGRYGITNRLEVEGRLPYVWQSENSLQRALATGSSNDQIFNTSGKGIGDAEVALRYQFNQPVDGGPYYIGNLRVKSNTGKGPFDVNYVTQDNFQYQTELPTGSGFWGYQFGASAILPSDPAVFFGTLSYTWNQKASVNKVQCVKVDANSSMPCQATLIGTVDPGDVVEVNFGMGVAINDRSSFSIAYDHNYIGKSKVNGVTPVDAYAVQVGMLQLGYAYRLTKSSAVNLTLGIGTTQDSPGVQLTLRAPITF